MASTIRLYGLDVDSPALRQLNVKLEGGENRLMVSDTKQTQLISEIKDSILSLTPTTYEAVKLFDETAPFTADSEVADSTDKSKMVDVARLQKLNIYYEDTAAEDNHAVIVMGRIGGAYKELDNNLNKVSIDFVEDHADPADVDVDGVTVPAGRDVELFRFYPRANSDGTLNTSSVIDLNVNGITKVYLKTEEESKTITNAQAYVAGQF